jgi:hypothetical protein
MQINTGDKVRFLNDIGGGIVTRIVDANTVMVLNEEDDFEIPTLKKNLVVVETAENNGNQQKQNSSNQAKVDTLTPSQEKLFVEKEDIYIAFVPREGYQATESPLELYLINDTNQILLYNYFQEKGDSTEGVTAGNLDPKSKILLNEYDQKELNELGSCSFQILFYQQGKFELQKPLEKNIKIQPVKFYKSSSYKETAYFHQEVILYKLTGENLADKLEELSKKEFKKIIREKESKNIKTPNQLKTKDQILEIDLHINELIDSVTGLSNADILEFQLNKFHEVLRENEQKKDQRIVFIHGIGNGTLKKKIHEELRRKYKKHYQQDASFKEYGWGATMVTIK